MTFSAARKSVNKGTGLKSGSWLFEEFLFAESVFGMAVVEYVCNNRHLRKAEIAEGDLGKPFELEITEPRIRLLEVHDDDGNNVLIPDDERKVLEAMVLERFKEIEEDVLDEEMGIL